jgi:hypothetical protein
MHADDVPESGIYYNSQHIIVVNTGAITSLASPQTWAHSQMTDWEATNIITAGRTLSTGNSGPQPDGPATPSGHFVFISLAKLPREDALAAGLPAEGVLLVGNGQYRNESIYLAYVPKKNFIVGGKNDTNNTIQYFIGLDGKGLPTWTAPGPAGEMMATPIVIDAPNPGTIVTLPIPPGADPGTAGNTSIRYNKDLGMWLLIWDGGRIQQPWLDGMPQPPKPTQYTGIYFSEAPYAWGPWSTPQPIFVPCGNIGSTFVNPPGFGNFMRYTYKGSEGGGDDMCNNPAIANDSGPAGPIIGDPDPFDPGTTGDTAVTRRGANYAPSMVPGLTSVNGNTLTVDFNMSTWNPYATVLMQSNFTVVPPALGSVGSSPSTPTPSALQ